MKAPLIVRELAPSEFDRWDRLVAEAPEGSIYNTAPYLGALCESTGADFRILSAAKGDELQGGVALYEQPSRWGTIVSPRLLLYYNGLVTRPDASQYPSVRARRRMEIQQALETALSRQGYVRLCLKSCSPLRDVRVFQQRGWRVVPTYTYVVPLTDLKALWQRMEQNLRRLVTRCETQGLTVSDDDDFESLFRMHFDVHRRKGAPLYLPKAEFERYFKQLKAAGLCRLYQARLPDGRSISAQLVLTGSHAVSHTVCAASDGEFLSMGASAYLRWKAFEALAGLGHSANDLTDAALNPVSRFKSQLGADLHLCLQIAHRDEMGIRLRDAFRRAVHVAGNVRRILARPPNRTRTP
ncbi:MAG: GNAT family N-acetyltransferase [Gemmatimonadales bacterium]|nr:GNAT family N-acetyltransferase [Gemmatimonadales bacterium]